MVFLDCGGERHLGIGRAPGGQAGGWWGHHSCLDQPAPLPRLPWRIQWGEPQLG